MGRERACGLRVRLKHAVQAGGDGLARLGVRDLRQGLGIEQQQERAPHPGVEHHREQDARCHQMLVPRARSPVVEGVDVVEGKEAFGVTDADPAARPVDQVKTGALPRVLPWRSTKLRQPSRSCSGSTVKGSSLSSTWRAKAAKPRT